MKYLKLTGILLSVWLVVYAGLVGASLNVVTRNTSTVAVDLMQRNLLPRMLQPSHYTYTQPDGKTVPLPVVDLDAYTKKQAATPLIGRLIGAATGDSSSPEPGLLYGWCLHVLPWLSLLLAIWLLNIAAGIKRLADALSGSK